MNIKAGPHLAVLQPLEEITVVPTQQRTWQINTRESEESWGDYKQVGELVETTGSQLRPEQRKEMVKLLQNDKTVFSDDAGTLGQTTLV